ncbi:MAG: hypothetical protein HGA98_04100 [Deltaproteobacteria bacterium]|nr:hypothetical protein [Deltaproteobacteria bacterium]
MPKKSILPTIDAVYDEDGLAFYCDGEPIEDMEFTWEDLADPELLTEVAEEVVEYIDSDELEDVDNPIAAVRRALTQLRKSRTARKAVAEEDDDEEDLDEDFEEEDDD